MPADARTGRPASLVVLPAGHRLRVDRLPHLRDAGGADRAGSSGGTPGRPAPIPGRTPRPAAGPRPPGRRPSPRSRPRSIGTGSTARQWSISRAILRGSARRCAPGSLAQRMLRKSVIQHETATSRRSRRQWMNARVGKQSREQAQVHVIVRHLVHDAFGRAAVEVAQPFEVLLGQPAGRPASRWGTTVPSARPSGSSIARDGLERLRRHQPQLAGAVDARNGWPGPARSASCRSAAGRRRRPAGGSCTPPTAVPAKKSRVERLRSGRPTNCSCSAGS